MPPPTPAREDWDWNWDAPTAALAETSTAMATPNFHWENDVLFLPHQSDPVPLRYLQITPSAAGCMQI